jgi:hypothetical protein
MIKGILIESGCKKEEQEKETPVNRLLLRRAADFEHFFWLTHRSLLSVNEPRLVAWSFRNHKTEKKIGQMRFSLTLQS